MIDILGKIGAIAPIAFSVLSTAQSIVASGHALTEQKREIERRLNELYRSGRESDYQQAQSLYESGEVSRLARFFLIEDIKTAALAGSLGIGAGFAVKRYLL